MRYSRVYFAALGLLIACGSDPERARPAPSDPNANVAGSGASASSAGAANQSGSGAGAGIAGSVGGGGSGGSYAGGAGPTTAGTAGVGNQASGAGAGGGAGEPTTASDCDPTHDWSNVDVISELATPHEERLLALSADERSLVFERSTGANARLLIADRADPSAPFEVHELDVPAEYDWTRGVALNGDGSRLLVISQDGRSFAELARSERGASFGAALETWRYAPLNTLALYTGAQYRSPRFGLNGQALSFLALIGTWNIELSSITAQGDFGASVPLDTSAFVSHSETPRILTGIARDLRAVFYWDAAESAQRVAHRRTATQPFYDFTTIAGVSGAIPNAECDRLYVTREGDVALAR